MLRSLPTRIAHFIVPPEPEVRKRRLELTVWSFLLSLAFYPGPFGALAWISLVRPFTLISRLKGLEAFHAAYFFAFCFNAFSLYWIVPVTPPGTLAAVVIVSFYYALILLIFNKLFHFRGWLGIACLPFLWTGMEYFRTLSEFAFPWSDLGYTQSYFNYILQFVSVVGVHGLTFLIVLVNVLFWVVLRQEVSLGRRLLSFWLGVATIVGLAAYGWVVVPALPYPGEIKVAILQGSVPVEEKWRDGNEDHSFRLYDSLARSVQDPEVELYVWPETSAPAYLSNDYFRRHQVAQTAQATGGYQVVGAMGATLIDSAYRHHNSAYVFDPDGRIQGRHDKVKLVPFTEQVPYQDHLGFLRRDFLMQYLTFIKTYNVNWWSDFLPGDSAEVFELSDSRFGVLICFECTFPEYCREMILDGADFLVGITNDTWFGTSVGIHQHSRIFVTRAVENRCWMARSANSGLSYVVDAYGRIRDELPVFEVAALRTSVRKLDGFSVFTRHGDVTGLVSFLLLVTSVGILIGAWVIRKFTAKS